MLLVIEEDIRVNTSSLTAGEQAVLEALHRTVVEVGYQPSMRELGEAVGLRSASSVHHRLRRLEEKGYLRLSGRPRGIELL